MFVGNLETIEAGMAGRVKVGIVVDESNGPVVIVDTRFG